MSKAAESCPTKEMVKTLMRDWARLDVKYGKAWTEWQDVRDYIASLCDVHHIPFSLRTDEKTNPGLTKPALALELASNLVRSNDVLYGHHPDDQSLFDALAHSAFLQGGPFNGVPVSSNIVPKTAEEAIREMGKLVHTNCAIDTEAGECSCSNRERWIELMKTWNNLTFHTQVFDHSDPWAL